MISLEEAIEIFFKAFPDSKADTIFDYGDCYYIENAVRGDFVDGGYIIDKTTGKLSSIDFLEWTNMIRQHSEDDLPEYKIQRNPNRTQP